MKHLPLAFALFFAACTPQWRLVPGHISTTFSKKVTPQNAWQEYPRPQMTRTDWQNLNGLWHYAIVPKDAAQPSKWQGNILVPFPVESALSGVKKAVGPEQRLWYRRYFNVPEKWSGQQVLLHFEAVDFETEVWINGQKAGKHLGGYDPFEFEISRWLKSGKNELIVAVFDPSDSGTQATGKQAVKPEGIWYTPSTGIWQTVWLEPMPAARFSDFKLTPDVDKGLLKIEAEILGAPNRLQVVAEAFFKGQKMAETNAPAGDDLALILPNAIRWSPDEPNLYDLKLKLLHNGKVVDEVGSYFGMRKIALGKDVDGFTKMFLNNRFLFQNGPLDQGFWPDGLYTPPSDEAMRYDLEMTKRMGFNMLRKHVKVESRRFYYWCDRLGILVWQDMPSGDVRIAPNQPDIVRTQESAGQFETELKQLITQHFNHPSIVVWVPFNEGWGQYETARITDFVKNLDPTRLVNSVSGWNDRGTGDILDWHSYPHPNCPPPEEKRAVVVGEFGGLGLKTEGHMWEKGLWGYATFQNREALLTDYEKYYTQVFECRDRSGLSASVYTQTTDVETEANGLMTYDRLPKHDPEVLRIINSGHFLSAPEAEPPGGMLNAGDPIRLRAGAGATIHYTLDGSEPTTQSPVFSDQIKFEKNLVLRARAYLGERSSRPTRAEFTLTSLKKPRYLAPYALKYRAGNDFALIDGKDGSTNFSDGNWQGFLENDLEVLFELERPTSLRSVGAGFLENTAVWIFLPKRWSIFVSSDGVNFEKAGEAAFEQPKGQQPARIVHSEIEFTERTARFIKIKAENVGHCPDWHPGQGGAGWIFADEVEWR